MTSSDSSVPVTPKFCKDCKHFDPQTNFGYSDEMAKCKKTKTLSAVTGVRSYSGAPVTYCSILREYSSGYAPRCGPNADWYVPK